MTIEVSQRDFAEFREACKTARRLAVVRTPLGRIVKTPDGQIILLAEKDHEYVESRPDGTLIYEECAQ